MNKIFCTSIVRGTDRFVYKNVLSIIKLYMTQYHLIIISFWTHFDLLWLYFIAFTTRWYLGKYLMTFVYKLKKFIITDAKYYKTLIKCISNNILHMDRNFLNIYSALITIKQVKGFDILE